MILTNYYLLQMLNKEIKCENIYFEQAMFLGQQNQKYLNYIINIMFIVCNVYHGPCTMFIVYNL